MTDADLFDRFALVSAVASGAGTVGVGVLLFPPRTWVGRSVLATVSVSVMSGLAALLCPQVLGLVAGVGLLLAAALVPLASESARRLMRRFAQAVCRPRVAGAAAVLAAGGVWGYEAWRFDRGYDALMDGTLLLAVDSTQPPTEPTATAQTDCGSEVVLDSALAPISTAEALELERKSTAVQEHTGKFIRRRPPTDESNCHGWVFTGGRYNMRGRYVEVILSDNGYTEVPTPAAGDLCVYRDATGGVSHTGVVQGVLADGIVLVESKWGRMGVYLHPADVSCYGTGYTFYRTDRETHRLRGFESDSNTTAATATAP